MKKKLKEQLQMEMVKQALKYMESDPDRNLPKLIDWADRFDTRGEYEKHRSFFRNLIEDKDNLWYKYMKSLWTDIDDGVRMRFFENYIINTGMIGIHRQNENREKYNCNIPWAILLDPTSACNLNCVGCWAAEYGNRLNLSFGILDNIISQGKELGTFMYIFSGGEPLVRKEDMIKLCEKHKNYQFLTFRESKRRSSGMIFHNRKTWRVSYGF